MSEVIASNSLISEATLKAVRSSGKGGQHVNKVSTKVELQFDIPNSEKLSQEQKEQLLIKLKSRLTKAGLLILQCDTSRSQHKNKQEILSRFVAIISSGLQKEEQRKKTNIPVKVIKRRLDSKRRTAQKKAQRKKPDID